VRRTERAARECTYTDFLKCQPLPSTAPKELLVFCSGMKPSTSASGSQPSETYWSDLHYSRKCVPFNYYSTSTEVPPYETYCSKNDTPKPVVTLVYSRKPRKSKTNVPVSKPKIIKSVSTNNKEPEEHEDHLRTVLQTLRQEKLYAKFSKCGFWLSSVAFLGHIVSAEGITMDPAKVDAITKWPRPTSVTELMRKGEKFVWNEEREKSFEELKQRLVSAPILTLPSGSGRF
nr:putative reverse transcriptase domain-containing protein [Tanacetum cinerariifolium]